MNTRAGVVLAGVMALALWGSAAPAGAQELSEHAVRSFMEYAWSLTPQQFSKPDGSVIVIDKNKKAEVEVPIDVARDIIKATSYLGPMGRLTLDGLTPVSSSGVNGDRPY